MNDTFCMHLFCSNKRKPFLQIKPHLIAKCANSTGAGTVMFLYSRIKYMLKQIQILLHGRKLRFSFELRAISYGLWATCEIKKYPGETEYYTWIVVAHRGGSKPYASVIKKSLDR